MDTACSDVTNGGVTFSASNPILWYPLYIDTLLLVRKNRMTLSKDQPLLVRKVKRKVRRHSHDVFGPSEDPLQTLLWVFSPPTVVTIAGGGVTLHQSQKGLPKHQRKTVLIFLLSNTIVISSSAILNVVGRKCRLVDDLSISMQETRDVGFSLFK
jgi:hypothetical protein